MSAYTPSLNMLSMKRQQGMVLILVLLVVSLVVGLSVQYASQFHLGLARAESRWATTQARSLLIAAEEVAILLFPLGDVDTQMDYPLEPWSNEVPLTDEGIEGVAKLIDAQAQLNLNDLNKVLEPTSLAGSPERYSESQRQFVRLLQTFPQEMPISQLEAENLMEAVADWLDGDNDESGSGGAESNYYQGMPEPYLPTNGLFRSVDELRLVRGFNERPMLVTLLQPYLTVLPASGLGLSVNNLPVQNFYGTPGVNRLRLSMNSKNLLVPLDDQQGQNFLLSRPETGFADENELNTAWQHSMGDELDVSGYKVKTEFFWLESTIQMGDQRRQMRSLMKRDGTGLVVVQRRMMYELPRVDRGTKDDNNDSELKL